MQWILRNKNNFKNYSDQELIDIYRKSRDKKCIAELFTRYTHLVFGICLKYFRNVAEAEDTTMEIFENLFDTLLVHRVENFKNWLYSVARNKCLMIIRKNNRIQDKKSQVFENFYAENMENNSKFTLYNNNEEKTLLKKLEEALLMLKNEQQHYIRLMYIENHSYKEISAITGYGLNQVKTYIQNGKRKLKIFLENK